MGILTVCVNRNTDFLVFSQCAVLYIDLFHILNSKLHRTHLSTYPLVHMDPPRKVSSHSTFDFSHPKLLICVLFLAFKTSLALVFKSTALQRNLE
jgi:hypothetical protein